ncbi:2-succinylbenzoate-CoA ligase [[Phormidium ambiguum] IAM M-71]|uniref:2-succinylbenzoate-CoA ligase n=1 Tax=[Phormidium ambiguum] IAM M-71 TaxID=454136 RepID=A0A1U7IPS0_9CYAN|nr:2-succinylbenzoate--CoA ligase [Phormidium ambiguum]OKH39403.1 2-succinylbenzoate-CoA ligase [Phormidium ambiguum IAM M-71]
MADRFMESSLIYLEKRIHDNWLVGYDSRELTLLTQKLYAEITQKFNLKNTLKIVIAERQPIKLLASFIAGVAANCHVFLCNPDWVKAEWEQVFKLVQPDIIWGEVPEINYKKSPIATPSFLPNFPASLIMIPTGGSSGKIRFSMHTWDSLMASVKGFKQYFNLEQINSFCILPLYHVSGLMQFMRSFTSGGKLVISAFKLVENVKNYDIEPRDFFISLVPTQLQRLLEKPDLTNWLSCFQTVLLGGAPAWLELLETSRNYGIRLAPTYGMTETASQIATLKPEAFLAGNNTNGQILPHAKVIIKDENGEILGTNQTGIINIKADSLALGYYPELFPKQEEFQLDDLGYMDDSGNLKIIGRNSNKIITGGENVFPNEVEAAIMATQMIEDICVIGLPDRQWGEIITAIYVPKSADINIDNLKIAIQDKLSKFKQPKKWIAVESLPRNAQGKVNRKLLQQISITPLL